MPDFGQLMEIGQNFGKGYKNRKIGSTLKGLGPDASWEDRANAIMEIDPQLGVLLAKQGDVNIDIPSDVRSAQYFAKLPPGHPELVYAPRSPSSRVLPRIAINDLTEHGNTIEASNRLEQTFKEGYGGWKTDAAGHVANYAARNLGIGNEDASLWWQDYQGFSNIVRNKLFGSALTAQEKAQWDRANINPGMTDSAIRKNLALRKEIELRAARKLAKTYAKSGYDKATIEEAVGFSLDDDATPAAGAAPTAPASPEDETQQSLQNARAAIEKNPAIREQVIKRLIEANIDPSGL